MSSLKYWAWLSSVSGVGAAVAGLLLEQFGTPEEVFLANAEEYGNIGGVKPSDITKLMKKDLDAAGKILSSCTEIGCRIVTMQDAEYPDRLRNIYDPPLALYVRGILPAIDEEAAVAIVGTRGCTPYGLTAAEEISCKLASRGLLVVTGMARGIDTAAARGALRGGGRVVGVIGSGLDVIYPPENRPLFDDVALTGAIISEYPPGTPPASWNFPARNRILSGLSVGVAVLEAPKKSGALITAARALEQGRDVFAMPGNIDARNSEGSNALLRDGAIPLLCGENIADEYIELFPDKIKPEPAVISTGKKSAVRPEKNDAGTDGGGQIAGKNEKKEIDNATEVEYIDLDAILNGLEGDEKTVASTIGRQTMHIDEIIVNSGLPAQKVLTALTMLEIKDQVSPNKGKYFSIMRND